MLYCPLASAWRNASRLSIGEGFEYDSAYRVQAILVEGECEAEFGSAHLLP